MQAELSAIPDRALSEEICDISDMVETPEPALYRKLMAIKPGNMSPAAWMKQAGVSRSFLGDLRKRGKAKLDSIEKMIEAAGSTPAQFYAMDDPDHSPAARADSVLAEQLPFRAAEEQVDVPLLGTAMGADFKVGEDGLDFAETVDLFMDEVIDHLRRPLALRGRKDVYALNVVGSSMSPRYDPGDPAYADPKQTPRIGDDVIVYLLQRDQSGDGRIYSVLVKRLRKRTASYLELQQFDPALTFTVPTGEVAMVHRVIPWRELVNF